MREVFLAASVRTPIGKFGGLIELNEGFAAQVLACDRELGFDHDRPNVNGGAIALGRPDRVYRSEDNDDSSLRARAAQKKTWPRYALHLGRDGHCGPGRVSMNVRGRGYDMSSV